MKCPVCPDATLVMSDRQGVEIDYCPQCRGVWLDRGELDKIIERSQQQLSAAAAPQMAPPPAQPSHHAQPQQGYPQQGYPQHGHDRHGDKQYGKRRKSFWEEIFD